MSRHSFIVWSAGLLVSFLFTWGVTAVFVDSISVFVWDDLLESYAYKPNTTLTSRSEGWADTVIGKHRFIKGEDAIALSNAPKFIYWGDSQVEALQLQAKKKPMGVFNTLS